MSHDSSKFLIYTVILNDSVELYGGLKLTTVQCPSTYRVGQKQNIFKVHIL